MQFIQEHIIIGLHIIVSYSYLYSARIYWWWDSSQWRGITQSRIRINMLHQKLSWAVFHLVATSAKQCLCYPPLVNVKFKSEPFGNLCRRCFHKWDFNIPFQQFFFPSAFWFFCNHSPVWAATWKKQQLVEKATDAHRRSPMKHMRSLVGNLNNSLWKLPHSKVTKACYSMCQS